ncbi:unnamed protein product [Brassicogethes aeneus]|uniref:GH18 domain-containing protein n=1 Tax=Brassicogethes aeneus TaxID=1431903 RepID=A0A9P0AVT4_BRAAE|nr:unnamed protein product [Brassicogethes aeneus]
MYSEDHTRYVLLTNGANRTNWRFDRRTLILLSVIILPIVFFCGTYMTLFGVYEKTVYPITQTLNVPDQLVERSDKYGKFVNVVNTEKIGFLSHIKNISDYRQYKLVCYYNFPQNEIVQLKGENIDPNLCTHLNLAFVSVVNNTLNVENSQLNDIKRILLLKNVNKDLKILLSVGGAGDKNGWPEMVKNHTNRKSFIKSVMTFIKTYKIDGVDLDWEFPNINENSDKKQKQHFTQLLEEMFIAKRRQYLNFLITLAVAAPVNIVDFAYDIPYINEYVDFINLMSYDYHFYTKFTPFTGLNSPLYGSSNEASIFSSLNINYSVNYWNYKGMDKSKIVVGLPTYGHSFKLVNARNNGLYAPARGYGKLGSKGFIDFSQVCTFLALNHITPVFDLETKSPYASKYTEWISFDDAQSLSYKAEFIRDNHFGGAMVYSLNTDRTIKDFAYLQGKPIKNSL